MHISKLKTATPKNAIDRLQKCRNNRYVDPGLNMTKRVVEEGMFAPVEAGVSSEGIPDSLDWVEEGKVCILRDFIFGFVWNVEVTRTRAPRPST